MSTNPYVHETATVEDGSSLGPGTRVWHHAHVRTGARVGSECIIGKGAYIGAGVTVGDRCKIQNEAKVYEGAEVEDGVFIGPGAILANDRQPRAVTPDGEIKAATDWTLGRVHIERGASVGAGAIIVPDSRIGSWALVGAGAVVRGDVPPHGLVIGNPGTLVGYVCSCGHRLQEAGDEWTCSRCGRAEILPTLENR